MYIHVPIYNPLGSYNVACLYAFRDYHWHSSLGMAISRAHSGLLFLLKGWDIMQFLPSTLYVFGVIFVQFISAVQLVRFYLYSFWY